MLIDTSSWKSFKIVDLFDIKGGVALNKLEEELDGKYWHIGGGESNNGRSFTTNKWNFENIITVSRAGTAGASFYQKNKVFVGERTRALVPKFEISENRMLFVSIICNKTFRNKFSYGKGATTERLSKESIFLPTINDKPNWEYMEEFIDTISKTITKPPKFIDSNEKLDTSSWKEIKLTDLFEFKTSSDNILKKGKYPQISASGINRGKSGLTDNAPFEKCFTCAKDGQPGITFWHNYKFGINNHTTVCIPKFKCSDNIGLFLETIMTKSLIPRYNYGKALGLTRISKESIFLPIKDNNPDWEYMEEFMNNLIEKE